MHQNDTLQLISRGEGASFLKRRVVDPFLVSKPPIFKAFFDILNEPKGVKIFSPV